MSTSLGTDLAALARRLGIEPSYWNLRGERCETSPETARALCAAMGYEAATDASTTDSITRFDRARTLHAIDPVRVWREHASSVPDLRVRHPGGGDWLCQLRVENEVGEHWESERALPGGIAAREVCVSLPGTPFAPGIYRVELELVRGGEARSAAQRLIIAPRTALRFAEKLAARRVAGLWTNLYSVRSERNWGFGDLGDLRTLARQCGRAGADFVGVNPLHAVPFAPGGVSPYSPVSRFFRNPLYIEVDSVPELRTCEAAQRALRAPAASNAREALRAADRLDHAALWAAKEPVLRALHRGFERAASPERRASFETYRRDHGAALRDFATFRALELQGPGCSGLGWPDWPSEFRDPKGPAVVAFRERRSEEVAFQIWLQFELDEQLAAVAHVCRSGGQAIGLYFDLAVASARDSADTWAAPDCYASGVSIGAPPDAYAPEGQAWGLPPFDPHALRREGFESWLRLLRASLRHAGALRIDHVMGLQRQFWVPDGGKAADGAYVRFPLDDLLGILALESRRHSALVIGEDLGTVPEELPGTLASWGILSSSVYVFEARDGSFPAAAQLSARALATVGTHDLPPYDGYAAGRDLELRRALGTSDDEALRAAGDQRSMEVAALHARLASEGLIADNASPDEVRWALCELLGRSPAPLVGVSLDDVAGECEPINLPGIPIEDHPSWARRMSKRLESLLDVERLREELPRCRLATRADAGADGAES